MVIALLVMNFASIAHAECTKAGGCDGMTIAKSMDDSGDQDGKTQKSACDCCATCGGHHHHQAAFANGKAEHIAATSQTLHSQAGDSYFSQLHYPPSKPPKA